MTRRSEEESLIVVARVDVSKKKALESLDSRAVVRYRSSDRRDCVPLESLSCEKGEKVQEVKQFAHAQPYHSAGKRGI